ncbi:MAG: hypothetical protein V4671_17885, partial [Armatimonadota bacterium]
MTESVPDASPAEGVGEGTADAEGGDTHPLPMDANEWRVYIASLSGRDLVQLAQKDKDKSRTARLFAGFRPAPDLLKNPVVLSRFVEEAQKQPKFAEEILKLSPVSPAPAVTPSPHSRASSSSSETKADTTAIKAKLEEHRKSLREKDERILALQSALSDAQRERDTLRTEAEAAQSARVTAEAEAERQRHRRERETRRLEQKAADAAVKAADAPATAASVHEVLTPGDNALNTALFEDAMRRLLSRGRTAVVAEVCREALLLLDDASARSAYGRRAEGVIRSLAAESIAAAPSDLVSGEKQRQQSEEQERLAMTAFLEAGDVAGAAESWARLVARRISVGLPIPLKQNDAALLARLAALMERMHQEEAVRAAFDRVRGASPEVTTQLQALFTSGGKKLSPLLRSLITEGKTGVGINPEEMITLPGAGGVTARRIVTAVDTGDAAYIRQVRAGLLALRERSREGDTALAEGLTEAVARINPVAACPLLQKSEPRPIVVDASNVARHDPDPLALTPRPRVAVLRQMRDFLLRRGWFPILMIADANLRHHMDNKPGYLALVEAGRERVHRLAVQG